MEEIGKFVWNYKIPIIIAAIGIGFILSALFNKEPIKSIQALNGIDEEAKKYFNDEDDFPDGAGFV
ncbi:MAG: hypothetical protein H3C35_03575 [Bacteroidetes bacterium]|nr:hypothetical protein [Bacteroidota bacterium]